MGFPFLLKKKKKEEEENFKFFSEIYSLLEDSEGIIEVLFLSGAIKILMDMP